MDVSGIPGHRGGGGGGFALIYMVPLILHTAQLVLSSLDFDDGDEDGMLYILVVFTNCSWFFLVLVLFKLLCECPFCLANV